MGHSAKYHAKKNSKKYQFDDHYDDAPKASNDKKTDAWRKIEEYKMFKQFCHDLEFYDDHLGGKWDDYLK